MNLNEWKIFSQKLILSLYIAIVATVGLFSGYLPGDKWFIIVGGIFGTYIVGKFIDKKKADVRIMFIPRLKALLSREFIAAIAFFTVATIAWRTSMNGSQLLSTELWFSVATSVGGLYNIYNPLVKQ